MKKILFTILLGAILSTGSVVAQNQAFPNAIHAKLDFNDFGLANNQDLRLGEGFEIGYFRNVASFLNIGVPLKVGLAKLPGSTVNTVITSADLVLHLENTRSDSKLIPYAFGGAGYFLEKFDNGHVQIPVGAGLKIRLSQYAALNLQGEYRLALADERSNLQFGIGFVSLLHLSEKPALEQDPNMPADVDKDGVPDVLDKCPEIAGPAAALGCPDRDSDGIGDTEDLCPDEAGSLETSGCPDTDNDGFANADDECPEAEGTVRGCPDADFDGFADKDDQCPDIAGRWNGCPDTDFDGVADKDDKCPNDPGPATNNGCPQISLPKDSDADGFTDDTDQCPDIAGRLNGCPDTDNDGIADKDDNCPTEAGIAANNGCPEVKLKPADADNDGFADNADDCPTTPGTYHGCPDIDGDETPDKADPCPTQKGPKELFGCPDTDGDGWADKDDPCPNEKGAKGSNGCPDSDGDGLADKDDPCPKQKGTVNGCPDTDGDGLADKDDPCPTKSGKLNGCPDSDGDGLSDKDDKCPDQAGPSSNSGCPEAKPTAVDSDGDGFADDNDPCPKISGRFKGCPDSDNDGVADNLDKCPNNPGPESNRGCPEIKQETKQQLTLAMDAVQFETAKATLKSVSFDILDGVAEIMRQYPDYKLSISGHTDDVGDEDDNLQLSTDRAKTCYDYLLFRGIKAERLRYAGFGEARPIADNNTAAGREKNRRVEFELTLD